ncbi:MAG: DUF6587 family protein [Pseudomonadota bacterium]
MQELCVALIVSYALWTVFRRYAPNQFLYMLYQWGFLSAKAIGMLRLANVLEEKSRAFLVSAGGCKSGCSSCKGCGTKSQSTQPNHSSAKKMMFMKEIQS